MRPIFRYFAFLIGLVLAVGLGWGIYTQFVARPPETPSLALPTTPPTIISFQGRLTDSVGTPITEPISATFRIYNIGVGGTALWTENKNISPDLDGIFATKLGDTTPMDPTIFRDNMNLYLGIEIDGDGEMEDRQQIATVGYAYNSQYLNGYEATTSAIADTIPIINNSGDLVIAAANPTIESTSGDFAILGQTLVLNTASDGDITIQPNGTGQTIVRSGTTDTDSFYVQNATLTSGALISGEAGTTGTGFYLLKLAAGDPLVTKFSVDAGGETYIAGSVGIGTTNPGAKLDVEGDLLLQSGTSVNNIAITVGDPGDDNSSQSKG